MNPIEDVRNTAREVAAEAEYVRIGLSGLESYAKSLPLDRIQAPELDTLHHYTGRPVDTVAFILTLDAVNFGSGYFPHLRKRPGLSGYFTVATSLTESFRARGPFHAEELSRITAEGCAAIFGQVMDGSPASELMGLFAKAWNDLGQYLLARFGGRFERLVDAADHSAARLVELLAAMPFFRDVESYKGREVPFYKRAQLTAADLALALNGRGYGAFTDLDRLTIFADNLVPHVLRLDGVLVYDKALVERIEGGELIPAGSPEEVEIRASAVHAVELLSEILNVRAMELDYLLWNRGQRPEYKARPRHRTRTVYY